MTNLIMGIHAIEELLHHKRKSLIKVLSAIGEDKALERKKKLLDDLKANNVPIIKKRKNELNELVGSQSHGNLVAYVKPRDFLNLQTFYKKDPCCILALDSIYDPHNMGAIFRACECFKVDGVLFSKNRGCPITPVVAKSSSGASELLPLIKVSNLATSLKKLQQEGFSIIIADLNDRAENAFDFEFPDKFVLVMGSEEKGVQSLIRKIADHILMLPMFGKIDSLNVTQATSVFLSLWRRFGGL